MTKLGMIGIVAMLGCMATAAPTQTVAKSAAQSLTDESVREMLTTMGYEPKKLDSGSLISIKRDDWTYHIQVVLSKDGTKLGFNSNLGLIDDLEKITAEQWRNLMISNGEIDPSFFFLEKDSKKLYLHRSIDTRGLEAAYLRKQIDNFCGNIKNTADLWKFTK